MNTDRIGADGTPIEIVELTEHELEIIVAALKSAIWADLDNESPDFKVAEDLIERLEL